MSEYTKHFESIAALRDAGFAIVMFHPFELSGADPDQVEVRLVDYGWDIIDFLREENEDDESAEETDD